jgi:hypothetical protein
VIEIDPIGEFIALVCQGCYDPHHGLAMGQK